MSISIPKVQPGDLITAAFINGLIDQLVALDGRVKLLESSIPGTKLMLIFSPLPTDSYRIGEELRIVGQGFGIPALCTVTFDGTARVASFKAGSNDNLLILDIPTFIIPQQGKVVTLSVSNATGFATTSFTLLPPAATIPTGQLFLAQTPGPQQQVFPPGFDLVYTVSAAVTMADTYTFTPQFTNAGPGWDAFLVDGAGNRIGPDFQIGAQSSATIRARVTLTSTSNGTTAQLTINIVSKNNPTTVRSVTTGLMLLTVGGLAPGSQKIGLTRGIVADNQGSPIQPDGQGVYALPIARAPASFFFLVSAPPGAPPANYSIAPKLAQGAVGWPTAPTVADPPSGKLQGFSGQKNIQISVTPQAGGQPTTLIVTVTADADPINTMGSITLPIRAV